MPKRKKARTAKTAKQCTVCLEGFRCGDLLFSFQRYAMPESGAVREIPRSCGILPLAATANGFLLPVRIGEAFWIGVTAAPDAYENAVFLRALTNDGKWRYPEALLRGSLRVFLGISNSDGSYTPFGRPKFLAVVVIIGNVDVRIDLSDPTAFTQASGQPAPGALDPSSAYGGWRLP